MQTPRISVRDRATRASELRARSRTAATDLLKTVVSLSTGAIAVIFAVLTGKDTVVKPGAEATAVLLAVIFFVAAVLAGLSGWLANSRRYYQESLTVEGRGLKHKRRSGLLKKTQLACFFALPVFFSLGVIFTGRYILLRTLNQPLGTERRPTSVLHRPHTRSARLPHGELQGAGRSSEVPL